MDRRVRQRRGPQRDIPQAPPDRVGQRRRIADRHQQPRAALVENLARPGRAVGTDHNLTDRQRLQQNIRQPFHL
ncbi:hypothetical protein D3C72_752700 [compost metagenome]